MGYFMTHLRDTGGLTGVLYWCLFYVVYVPNRHLAQDASLRSRVMPSSAFRRCVMALNMSDDEDIDFRRQHFQHPDDADDIDLISESDGEAEQVHNPSSLCSARKFAYLLGGTL